ncbi:MAG: tripartite motif-containing protein 71 [Planctomycetota bacterium]|jgi:tripartite motif-containing protein 71
MIAYVPLLFALAMPSIQEEQNEQAAAPLGQHLRDLDDIPNAGGMALDNEGGLLVVEQITGRLLRIDPDGTRRVLKTGLRSPRDIELAEDGSMWVSEAWGGDVLHLDAKGKSLGSLGGDLFLRASGLAVTDKRIYVTDRGRHCVEVFNADGEHLFGFGEHGFLEGQMIEPMDIAVDDAGQIFISDRGNSRIQVFDPTGKFLRTFGDWGPFPGLFSEPTGLAFHAGRLFVADRGNHRVQVFDDQGELLDRFGLHAIRPREGAGFLHYPEALAISPNGEFVALAEPVVDRVQIFCRTGGTPEDDVRRQAQQLARPSAHYGMEVETAGIYLVMNEPESHSVVIYENTADEPRRITRISGLGTKTGLLTGVGGMDFDRKLRDLWVCDPSLRRLSMFRLRGSEEDEVGFDGLMARFVKSVDMATLYELEMKEVLDGPPEPVAIDRDEAGRFYLCDRRNGCIVVLSKDLHFIEAFGSEVLMQPTGIVLSAGGENCYVADTATGVYRFEGKDRKVLSYLAPAEDPIIAPHDIAVGPQGELFVTDHARHRVSGFDADGKWLRSWGGAGIGRGEFYKPRGIAFDQRGNLLVLDHANHRGMTYTPEGEYVGVFGLRLYTREARNPKYKSESESDE